MGGYKVIAQLVLIVISVVIIVTYIQPTLAKIRDTQEVTDQYKVTAEKSQQFINQLNMLRTTADSFSVTDLRALERYMPDAIDAPAVLRDVETILLQNNVQPTNLSYGEVEPLGGSSGNARRNPQGQDTTSAISVTKQRFLVDALGTYDQLKNMLRDFERSAYPLEVASLSFTPTDNLVYTFHIELETYAFKRASDTESE